ncbi:MAG: hypothetical protein ACR2QV_13010 [Gammaproteobacteria bacterium]
MNKSVIGRTGQWWKVALGMAALLFGSIAPLFEGSGISVTVGTVIAIVGYGLSIALLRCPGCGEFWFWRALMDASLYRPLFTKPGCPSCGHEY